MWTTKFQADFRTHSYQQIAGGYIFQNKIFDFIKGREVVAVSSECPHPVHKVLGADTDGIFLPGSIDIGQDYLIRNRQSLRKIIKEGLGSGLGMRLEDHPELPMLGRLGSG